MISQQKDMEGNQMPRQARLDAPGTLHHVMIRGIEKRNIVERSERPQRFSNPPGSSGKRYKYCNFCLGFAEQSCAPSFA